MLKRLQSKWGVSPLQLVWILCTFAIGGSLSGYLAKSVMALGGWEKSLLWWLAYIFVVTCLWPLCVLLISIPFGQFPFFRKYLHSLGRRLGIFK